jgi:acyl-CoA dehydrogenase
MMLLTISVIVFLVFVVTVAYFRWSLLLWSFIPGALLAVAAYFSWLSIISLTVLWIIYALIAVPLNFKPLRRLLFSKPVFRGMRKVMPTISQTEQEALDAGDVWWEAELFSGRPNFKMIQTLPAPKLNADEQAFIDGPVEQFCAMIDDWQITQEAYDLTPDAWEHIKKHKFFGMIIPKKYGGLEYSALAHSEVVMKIASRSGSAAVTVMVPNSLGPGKLLMTYGTKEQKDYYLPRLASGEEVPCFGLTGPEAGSDAGAMPDNGVVCYGSFAGEDKVLGIRLNWEKRYITLAPVATLLGIAFKLYDPEHLLGDKEDIGITLALVKRDTPGVEIGRRHFPANQSFMNGPIRGKDVFIPLDQIIGGIDYVGKGWSMLMECLTDGRAISLPAMSTSAGKVCSKFTGAYSRVRSQFHTPIGYFEGVEEALAAIGGQAYAMDAARLLILSSLDNGAMPSVLSGVVKQQLTERMRKVMNHAMDIHGGHGICMGPHNFLGRGYQLIPVGITVEGANILTRTMMIFGQGALRSHPYLLKEVQSFHNPNAKKALRDFDNALFAHVGFVISNVVRSFVMGITGGRLIRSVPGSQHTKYYYQQLVRMSSAFALISDVCLGILGGTLKRREKISGRLADALSNMYVLTAVLRHFENNGESKEDLPLMQWAAQDALFNIQTALKGVLKNLPLPFVGRLLNILLFSFTRSYQLPSDELGHKVARMLMNPSAALDRLTHGIYVNNNPEDATGRLMFALEHVLKTNELEKNLRVKYIDGVLDDPLDLKQAYAKHVINDTQLDMLVEARAAVQNAIKVDEFSFKDWQVETPTWAQQEKSISSTAAEHRS